MLNTNKHDGSLILPAAPTNLQNAASEPYVRIRDVRKQFGSVVAVNGVSLDIYKGELFSLLGASGSGKSTLLRMLAGLETPTSGTVEIDGVDMTDVPTYARPTNMMFQSYALFPHMNVAKNIAYGLYREGAARSEIRSRVDEMLDLVQLAGLGHRKPHQLSGGQRQRVALARSLIKRPKLLLLDEPLAALDKKLREETQFELIKVQETLGITFVVVTHDQDEAMTLSDRIGIMREGNIVQLGDPQEVYEFPNSRFSAEFVGSVNLFEGFVVEDRPDHITLNVPEINEAIHIHHGVSCTPNQRLWFAIRPEKLRLTQTRPDQPNNSFEGTVLEVGYVGGQSKIIVSLSPDKTVKVMQVNTVRSVNQGLSSGDKVFVSWDDNAGVVLQQ